MVYGLLLGGLILLVIGAEMLIRAGTRLAAAAGVSPLVIGLTLVAYGTSTPELAVSVKSALQGQADISLGNVVGSNIFNILFILGLSAIVAPLTVSRRLLWRDVPLMLSAAAALWLLSLDGHLSRGEGLLLTAGIILYTIYIVRGARSEKPLTPAETHHLHAEAKPPMSAWVYVGIGLLGLGALVLGTNWFVGGAVKLAQSFGVSELVIGLTIVAAGTSLPEVFTSVLATFRGERDIAIGNVVGSNIYNILAVQGLSCMASSTGVSVASAARSFDIPVMMAATIACLPIFFTGHRISRWEGFLFLAYYGAYTLYLILRASAHDALTTYQTAMWTFVLPLTFITLAVVLYREIRAKRLGALR